MNLKTIYSFLQFNNIHRTKKLAVDAVCINDNLYAEYERLRSCSDWCDNSPRFDLITKAWAEVIRDYVKPTERKAKLSAGLRKRIRKASVLT